MKPTLFAGVLLGTLSASSVFASTINTTDMMASFNVITLGALDSSSETEGTVYVGGSLTTSGYGVNNDRLKEGTVGGITGSLIVGGSVTGSINVQTGAVRIGGSNTATINQNGTGSVQFGVSGIPTGDVTAAFRKLSTDLAARSDTPGAEARADDENDLTVISGIGGSDGVAVVRGSSALVSTGTFKGVQTSTGSRADIPTIVNIPGETVRIGANFNETLSNVLFNFYEATTLDIDRAFNYSILAPFASVTSTGGGTNGVVVAGSLTQRNEFRPIDGERLFDGFPPDAGQATAPVPVPAPALLLGFALAALGFGVRKRS
ncbi:collagen-binding domain-containing protein [Roseovarius tibetensis]|uniref:collagen-binding domain-containing protein n=1 Tax=Roseovarius tibetensis TaxID=2685897 RepID=UPI003D7F2D3B